ncbi:hypothetical protein [Haladaptatus caseinilyticus]|uniref:hypothetical protein n=1 Tax=Haladaptatus caseinilyticus TaxID=2993314 RepID=UPI00224B5E87|nr:hypothetical protein [Haladaptatus caseinilyticus]
MRDEDYDPTTCPAAGCEYEDSIRSVAAHISGTDDDRHSWKNLAFDGARDFVIQQKRRQQGRTNSDGTAVGRAKSDSVTSSAATSTTGSKASTSEMADDIRELDLEFARDALVLLDLIRRYDTDSLAELDTFRLANLYTLLSDVSRGADDARKQVRDVLSDELQDDRTVPSDFGTVRRYTSRRRNQKDEAVIRAELERAGIDPREAMSFDTTKLKQFAEERAFDESTVFDFEERTYVKKAGNKSGDDGDGRREAFEALDPEIRSFIEKR